MTYYLITGVNRGIGLAFIDVLSRDKNNTVIGTVRNLDKAQHIAAWGRPNVHLIELDMASDIEVFHEAFKQIDEFAPNGLDVVMHNAGVYGAEGFNPVAEYKAESYLEPFTINVIGSIKTYQAVSPYLYKGSGTKKMGFISSIAGQMSHPQFMTHGYGCSKAALNFFMTQIKLDNDQAADPLKKNSVVATFHPGVIDTDMTHEFLAAADDEEFLKTVVDVERSVRGILDTFEKVPSGSFAQYDGTILEF